MGAGMESPLRGWCKACFDQEMASRGLAAAAPLPPPAEPPESPPEADDIACDEVALQEDWGMFKTFGWNMLETLCLHKNLFARWSPGEARKTYPYIVAELVLQSISRGRTKPGWMSNGWRSSCRPMEVHE